MTIRSTGGALLPASAVAVAACSTPVVGTASPSPTPRPPVELLDRAAAERDIAAQFEQQEGVPVELSCAEEMVVATGASHDCIGTTADGEDINVEITITGEDPAAYTWSEV